MFFAICLWRTKKIRFCWETDKLDVKLFLSSKSIKRGITYCFNLNCPIEKNSYTHLKKRRQRMESYFSTKNPKMYTTFGFFLTCQEGLMPQWGVSRPLLKLLYNSFLKFHVLNFVFFDLFELGRRWILRQ